MRRAAIVLAALLWATTAGAVDWAVNSNATLAAANAGAGSGDRVLVAPGTYTTGIAPVSSGVVYMGAENDSSGVSVASIQITALSNVTVKWLRCNGSLNITCLGLHDNPSSLRYIQPANDSVYMVRVIGSVGIKGALNFSFTNSVCGVGNTPTNGSFYVGSATKVDAAGPYGIETHIRSRGGLIQDVKAYYGGSSSTTPVDSRGNHAYEANGVQECTFRRFKFYGYYPFVGLQAATNMNYRVMWNTFEDCKWENVFNGTNGAVCHLLFLRDSSNFNSFVRDTFSAPTTNVSACLVNLTGSGSVTGSETQYGNSFDGCVWQGKMSIRWVSWARKSTYRNCVFNTTSLIYNGVFGTNVQNLDSLIFEHNTVHTTDSKVIDLDANSVIFSNASVRYNIFSSTIGVTYLVREKRTSTSLFDYNLFWTGNTADSTARWVENGTATVKAGPSAAWCTVSGQECNARWGNPRFADYGSGNFTPTSGTAADFGPDGYVGAIEFGEVDPADVDAPATIGDLSGAVLGPTRVNLSWTSPGDDGYSGVADTVLVRRRTSAFTSESDWTNSTQLTRFFGGTQSSGGEQQTYADNSAVASTTYFYAVRAKDEAGNFSGLSNTTTVTTPASPDVTSPSAVADMIAFPLGPTSIQILWSSTGDNGITGSASNYRLKRRAGSTFVLADSAAATAIPCNFAPKPPGQIETVVVSGLSPSTQYAFAVWVQDAAGNTSTISNAATASTTETPVLPSPSLASNNRRRRR